MTWVGEKLCDDRGKVTTDSSPKPSAQPSHFF